MSVLFGQSFAQTNQKVSVSNKATATLASTCTISASSVSFGSLILPVVNQSATSQLNLLCNKQANYTIELAYGGVYGSGNSPTGYTMGYYAGNPTSGNAVLYNIFDSTGTKAGTLGCYLSGGVQIIGNGLNTVFGYTTYNSNNMYSNTNGTCNDSTHTPRDWVGAYNATGTQSVGTGVAYDYGMITGAAKGNQLAYSIEVPGNPSKVWNKGINNYTGTGTGTTQSIPVKATLIPSKTSYQYPSPDLYSDTVISTVSF